MDWLIDWLTDWCKLIFQKHSSNHPSKLSTNSSAHPTAGPKSNVEALPQLSNKHGGNLVSHGNRSKENDQAKIYRQNTKLWVDLLEGEVDPAV